MLVNTTVEFRLFFIRTRVYVIIIIYQTRRNRARLNAAKQNRPKIRRTHVYYICTIHIPRVFTIILYASHLYCIVIVAVVARGKRDSKREEKVCSGRIIVKKRNETKKNKKTLYTYTRAHVFTFELRPVETILHVVHIKYTQIVTIRYSIELIKKCTNWKQGLSSPR